LDAARRFIRSPSHRTGLSSQPPYGVSTAEACACTRTIGRSAGEPREPQILPCPGRPGAQMINDLEPPVVRRHPEIGTLKLLLREAGAMPRRCPAAGRRYSDCSAAAPSHRVCARSGPAPARAPS
jgi:4-diphosphocytidyl-2C-methyl-D-erythritol kinase